MQALSSYKPDENSTVDVALRAIEDRPLGFKASPYFSGRGPLAEFVWPDWPDSLKNKLEVLVNEFHRQYPQLRPVSEGSPEWQAVFRDWRTDQDSVSVIASTFGKHFGDRLHWVESERDARGRIAAQCNVESIGEITLQLFWRDSYATPGGPLSDDDHARFQASVREVFNWASSRIRPILDTLHDKLSALYGDRFRGLYVFGSYARPDAGIELPIDSDLDVALVLSDFVSVHEERERFGDIVYDLSLEHGLAISVVPVREAEYREGKNAFTREISSYAVPAR